MKRLTTVFVLGVLLQACGGGPPPEPPAPPPLDPTGTYGITIEAEGMQVAGSLVIRGTADAYTGSIDTEMGGAVISDIMVDGNQVTFNVPDVGGVFTLVFDGDEFAGSFDSAMGAGSIFGMKQSGG